jgi:hypothetical protein
MRIEVRMWIDGVEMDLSPRVVEFVEKFANPGAKATWQERVRLAIEDLRGE